MSKGIYQYVDVETDEVVYVGKDSYIHQNKRHKQHLQPSLYSTQKFNQILQKNPDRYKYEVICESNNYSEEDLNRLEEHLIKALNPKFNFTEGGEGCQGYKLTKEQIQRKSEAQTFNHAYIGFGYLTKKGTQRYMLKIPQKQPIYRINLFELIDLALEKIGDMVLKIETDVFDYYLTNPSMLKQKKKLYARIRLGGFDNAGKRRYKLCEPDGKILDRINIHSLIDYHYEHYPNEELIINDNVKKELGY